MDQISLRQLRYFDALARLNHFGRAADSCAISQPALSMQIKELEDALGVVLIERGTRNVRLTRFGEEAAQRVRTMLRALDEFGDAARASQAKLGGRLRIGVIPTIAPYLMPAIIGKLANANSELDVQVRETLTANLVRELEDGLLDAAIVALPVSEPSLTEVPLFSEDFVLVRPASDKGKPVPAPEMLFSMNLLLLEEGHCFRDQALSFCGAQPVGPQKLLDYSSLSTLVQMVGAGIGVTLIPEMAVTVETSAAAVAVARFKRPRPTRTVGMVWRKTNPLAQQFLQLSELVRDSASNSGHRNSASVRVGPRAPKH